MYDKRIIHGRVFLDEQWVKTNLYIQGEKIALLSDEFFDALETIDATDLEVLPGLIDPHVHFALDLGFITSVDDFYHGSVAAAHGGVTTFIDFLEPVDCAEDLEKAYHKRLAQAKKSVVDYTFHATIKQPKGDLEAFVQKMKQLDLHTVKLFTTYSESNRRTDDSAIKELLSLSKKYNFVVLAHIEKDELIQLHDFFTFQDLPTSRPALSEMLEAVKLAKFTKETGGTLYMVHLSSGLTLRALASMYPEMINQHFFIESCPQYFCFHDDMLRREDGYLYTFAPPLRSSYEQQLLKDQHSLVYTIATDHCAFLKKDKNQHYLKDIPLGIGGIEHSFNVMRRHLGDNVIPKMTSHVAKVLQIPNKGALKEGYDADILLYKPVPEATIDGNHGACDYSIYQGYPSAGFVQATMVRGNFVMRDQILIGGTGQRLKGGPPHG